MVLLLQGYDTFRDEMAETFADRYALKILAFENIEQAFTIARQLSATWKRALQESLALPRRRQLQLRSRSRNLGQEIHELERFRNGKLAIDIDRLPPVVKAKLSYVWAAVMFAWVFFEGAAIDDAWLRALIFGFVLLIAGCYLLRNRSSNACCCLSAASWPCAETS
jgi:hypothetical protein